MGEQRFPPHILTSTNFRALAAIALRREGLTYREVGERLGVGVTQATSLAKRGERILGGSYFRKVSTP